VSFLGANIGVVQTGAGLSQNLYIAPIVAEDTAFQTAFQGATVVTTVEQR
jgi:hypothetical protein